MSAADVTIELLGRAGLRFRRGGRVMLVNSEVLGGPEHFMCVWRSSIERWDPPHDMEPITDADRSQIIEDIRRVVRSRGYGEISVV